MLQTVIRVLFIGNSLTAANDLPGTVSALADGAGARIECTAVAKPDFSLEDHWNDGDARRAIARGGWTFVVLQQGPSSLPASRALLEEYVSRFDAAIRAVHARTAIYMVWPSADRSNDFDGVSRSYTDAARLVGALLIPAGDAWRAAWRLDPQLALYGPDRFHPSTLGSTLAAIVMVEALTGRRVPAGAVTGLSVRDRDILLAAAGTIRKSRGTSRVMSGGDVSHGSPLSLAVLRVGEAGSRSHCSVRCTTKPYGCP